MSTIIYSEMQVEIKRLSDRSLDTNRNVMEIKSDVKEVLRDVKEMKRIGFKGRSK